MFEIGFFTNFSASSVTSSLLFSLPVGFSPSSWASTDCSRVLPLLRVTALQCSFPSLLGLTSKVLGRFTCCLSLSITKPFSPFGPPNFEARLLDFSVTSQSHSRTYHLTSSYSHAYQLTIPFSYLDSTSSLEVVREV